jgi:hypothetical protein
MNLSNISKAIAGGLVAVLVGEAARYGFQPSGEVVSAIGVIITALVSYVAGHAAVYFAPKNKP